MTLFLHLPKIHKKNGDYLNTLTPTWHYSSPTERSGYNAVWVVSILYSLGIILCLIHYLGNRSLRNDEATLTLHILRRSFFALLQPLDLMQIAPPGFLWLLKLVTELFGDPKPVLHHVGQSYAEGEPLYVYAGGKYPFEYYAPRFGLEHAPTAFLYGSSASEMIENIETMEGPGQGWVIFSQLPCKFINY